MARVRKSSKERKAELTDAALEIIAARGITALSTRSLASQVGLTSGAIFRHFASFEEVLEAVVERVEAVLSGSYPPTTLPGVERLERFVEARSTAVGAQLGILRLMHSDQFLLALPKKGAERLSVCVQETREFLLACLRDGQASGEIRRDLRPEALVPIVMGTVQMLALSSAGVRRTAVDAQCVRASLLVLLRTEAGAPPAAPKRGAAVRRGTTRASGHVRRSSKECRQERPYV